MTAEVLLYFWIIVSVKQKFWLITNLSIRQQKKHLSPKGVQFSWRLFAAHGKQTRSVNCTPVSKWKPRSSRKLNYILGQNISSFHTIGISVHDNERTIYFKQFAWSILMWGFFPFLLSFSLTLINPIFGGDFQDVLCNHYCNNSHYIPNQTAVNRQSKTIYLFTGKSTGNKRGCQ